MINKKFNINTLIYLLFLLLPILIISGPFLSDLVLILIVFHFLYSEIIKKKKTNIFLASDLKLFNIYYIFLFFLIFSSFFSSDIFYSLKSSALHIRFFYFSLAIYFILLKNNFFSKHLSKVFFYCFFFLIIDGFYQYYFYKNLFGFEILPGPRVSSVFGSESVLGSYIVRLLPIYLALIYKNYILEKTNLKFSNYLEILIIPFCCCLIIISGERTALFFLILIIIYLLVMINDFNKIKILIILLTFCSAALLFNYNSSIKQRIFFQSVQQINEVKNDNLLYFTIEHKNLYQSAFKIFKDNKVLGIGPKMFRKECSNEKYNLNKFSCSTHPHNTILQLLVEIGILGTSIYFIFFCAFIIITLKHLYYKFFLSKEYLTNYGVFLLASVLITLWPLAPSGNFFNNWLSIIYFYPLGFIFHAINQNLFFKEKI